jgi:hypothetical protein
MYSVYLKSVTNCDMNVRIYICYVALQTYILDLIQTLHVYICTNYAIFIDILHHSTSRHLRYSQTYLSNVSPCDHFSADHAGLGSLRGIVNEISGPNAICEHCRRWHLLVSLVDLGAAKKWGFQTWVEWSTGKINQRSSPTSLCSATSTETLIRICTYCTIIQWFITIFAPKKNRFKFQVHLIEISLHTDRRLHPEFKIHWRCCDTQAALKFNPTCTGVTVSDQSCGDGARPCDVSAQHLGFCLVLFHLFLSIRCATGNSADP